VGAHFGSAGQGPENGPSEGEVIGQTGKPADLHVSSGVQMAFKVTLARAWTPPVAPWVGLLRLAHDSVRPHNQFSVFQAIRVRIVIDQRPLVPIKETKEHRPQIRTIKLKARSRSEMEFWRQAPRFQ
jgi:hypothetical protein